MLRFESSPGHQLFSLFFNELDYSSTPRWARTGTIGEIARSITGSQRSVEVPFSTHLCGSRPPSDLLDESSSPEGVEPFSGTSRALLPFSRTRTTAAIGHQEVDCTVERRMIETVVCVLVLSDLSLENESNAPSTNQRS